MTWVFWISVALVAYAYLGYPMYLWLRSRLRPRPVQACPFLPSISIVMVVRNEAGVLERKLRNLMELNYPQDRTKIVVVSDGSTDDTNSILRKFAKTNDNLRIILKTRPQGKANGINDAIKVAQGEIVVFTDARQKIDGNAVRQLMQNFADSSVGCASGELRLGDPEAGERSEGLGLYWKIERQIRELEGISSSVIGATGALYAARRNLVVRLPRETILDDVYIPMHVLQQGSRVVFDPRSQVWDVPDQGLEREFARKVRTLSGNYQLLSLAPWLLGRTNPVLFEFVSHKLIRLLVPFSLGVALITSALASDPIYRIALVLQLAFYGSSAWAMAQPKYGVLSKIADSAFTFAFLNTAALVAFVHFVAGRKVIWAVDREPQAGNQTPISIASREQCDLAEDRALAG
jgi:poly-beta-1,6-N-acetyl-D-glucosamine synthase